MGFGHVGADRGQTVAGTKHGPSLSHKIDVSDQIAGIHHAGGAAPKTHAPMEVLATLRQHFLEPLGELFGVDILPVLHVQIEPREGAGLEPMLEYEALKIEATLMEQDRLSTEGTLDELVFIVKTGKIRLVCSLLGEVGILEEKSIVFVYRMKML